MENTKFKLLESDTIELFGKTLYRIEALKDFSDVSKGEKGGYIEKESNLATSGDAWVADKAQVSGNASVSNNAWVLDNAWVSGNARISGNALVSDDAQVSGNARVKGDAQVAGDASVSDNARISGNTWISGNTQVSGNAKISGNAQVSGNARINDISDLLVIGPIGSENGHLTAFKNKDKTISVTRGCFVGTLKEFETKVEETHGGNEYGKTYRIAIELIKNKLGNNKEREGE